MKNQRTLIIIKPDSIQRGLIGEIIKRFERKALKIVGLKMIELQEAVLREHYAHVVDRPFFGELTKFMKSSPVCILCLEGPNAIELARKISGTNPDAFGSIRGDFSVSPQRNLIHSSDSEESANEEIRRFFEKEELFTYGKDEWTHSYAPSELS